MKKYIRIVVLVFSVVAFNLLFLHFNYNKNGNIIIPRKLNSSGLNQKIDGLMVNGKVRVFCIILTQPKNINTMAKTIYDAWAHKCDNFKFVLKIPDDVKQDNKFLNFAGFNFKNESGAIEINNILEPANLEKDEYSNLATKVFLTLKYVYEKYDNYDWYLKADDDTFVFVDNMKQFLADKNPYEPITFGYNFKVIVDGGYHSGGGGYLMSNEAVKRLHRELAKNFTFCQNTGTEDVDINRCLRRLDVKLGNSTDAANRERFHPLSLDDFYYGNFPDWLHTYSQNPPKKVCLFYVYFLKF